MKGRGHAGLVLLLMLLKALGVCPGHVVLQPVHTFNVSSLCATSHKRPTAKVLFLHVFKAAGSSTRDMMKQYAQTCHLRYVSCGSACRGLGNSGFLCLRDGQLKGQKQVDLLRSKDVVAGHLWYGLHRHMERAVYVTCLREPLQTAVSSQLYLHSSKLKRATEAEAAARVRVWLGKSSGHTVNFVKRLTGVTPSNNQASLAKATAQAIDNLRTRFAVVGVVERYSSFVDLVQDLLDPTLRLGRAFWTRHKTRRRNSSEQSTSGVALAFARQDAAGLVKLNQSLAFEWKIYFAASEVSSAQAQARLQTLPAG